jgi:hypothetical protein
MNSLAIVRSPDHSAAYNSFRDEAVRERAERFRRRTLRRRTIGMSAVACALATTAFWATMLMAPPTSEASLFGFPEDAGCINAGQSLAPWFEGELRRAARVGAQRSDHFDFILTTFQDAQSQCASGRTDDAVASFQALANRIAKLEEHRSPTAD